jgi:glutamate-1-semialdehyde 2,1-aminomutase
MIRDESHRIFARNAQFIAGGAVSMNRKVEPRIAFVRGKGAHLWDADGNRFIDYHAGFAPYLLGHHDEHVEQAVRRVQADQWTLAGSGTSPWEGEAAELLCRCVPSLEQVQFLNTGSEATYLALRLARAHTGRDHIAVMQGGYNGWHDEVACNVMTPLEHVGPETHEGEYPFVPMSAGMPRDVAERVHVLQFNSLQAVEACFQRHSIAALITEPILQNIGVVKPKEGYLQGLRTLCDRFGVVLIMDEVKTGFRHALGGYQSLVGIRPDLSVFGKAIANGYPLGALGGKRELMSLFEHPDPAKRVLIAGTYNGHPVPMAAAIATMRKLIAGGDEFYANLDAMAARLHRGIEAVFAKHGIACTVARQGSALCPYLMDHAPESWHDLARNHDMDRDLAFRRRLIDHGSYVFPLPTKQWSVSAAHTQADIDETLEAIDAAVG